MSSIAARVQRMDQFQQALVLCQLTAAADARGEFSPKGLDELYAAIGIPIPSRASNLLASLQRRGWVRPGAADGRWKLTPVGRQDAGQLITASDLSALATEASVQHGPLLGHAVHTVIPPLLAPPALLPAIRAFLDQFPFEHNVFFMTRFPEDEEIPDPVKIALEQAREACRSHGLVLHLASDRALDDDLWTNVAAHMWACRYGIGLFEDRIAKGLNYNLTIEIGGMIATGRRCALLKDTSISRLPTDLVGRIYKEVDVDLPATISRAVHSWSADDLGLGPCRHCPQG